MIHQIKLTTRINLIGAYQVTNKTTAINRTYNNRCIEFWYPDSLLHSHAANKMIMVTMDTNAYNGNKNILVNDKAINNKAVIMRVFNILYVFPNLLLRLAKSSKASKKHDSSKSGHNTSVKYNSV